MSRIEPDTLTVRQVANVLGLNINTVYAMLRTEHFPLKPLALPTHKILFSRGSVDRFLGRGSSG